MTRITLGVESHSVEEIKELFDLVSNDQEAILEAYLPIQLVV